MLLSKHEFFENWQSERHTVLKGVNEIVPMFSTFCIWLDKFGTGYVHKNVLSDSEFCENGHSEGNTLLRGVNEFMYVFSTFIVWFGWNWV